MRSRDRAAGGARSPEAVTAAIRLHEATRDTLRAALVYNDAQAVEAPLDRVFAKLGITLDRTDEAWPRLARRAARALCEVAEENIRREQGIYLSDARLRTVLASGNGADRRPATASDGIVLPISGGTGALADGPAPEPRSSLAPQSAGPVAPIPLQHLEPAPHAESAPTGGTAAREVTSARSAPRERTEPPARKHARDDSVDPGALTADSPFSARFGAALFAKREENPHWHTNNLGNWLSTRKLVIEAFGDAPLS